MLVAGALLVVLFGLITLLLLPGWRAWTKGQRKSDVQQNGMVVVARVMEEFHDALSTSVVWHRVEVADPLDGRPARRDSVLFLSDRDQWGNITASEEGDPIWQKRVVFYHDGDTEQVRSQEIPLGTPSTEPTPLRVGTFTPDAARDRVVARHVRSFALNWEQPPMLHVGVETRFEGVTTTYESSVTPLLATFLPPSPSPSPSPSP